MAEHPALYLWTDAYLGDAYHLSTEEHGAYFLLLVAAWRSPSCRLRDDDTFLAKVTRASVPRWRSKLRPVMEQFWTINDGFWTQKRLLKEFDKAEALSQKRSEVGRAGAAAKALKTKESPQANGYPLLNQPIPIEEEGLGRNERESSLPSEPSISALKRGNGSVEYAFEGVVIKLSHADLARWQNAYHPLDLRSELTALDAFYADLSPKERGNWFVRASAALAKKHAARIDSLEKQGRRPCARQAPRAGPPYYGATREQWDRLDPLDREMAAFDYAHPELIRDAARERYKNEWMSKQFRERETRA